MPIDKFDTSKWNKIKKIEFLRRGGPNWQIDFSVNIDKLRKRQKYDEIWEIIKKRNNW